MSANLEVKIQLGLDELRSVRQHMTPLLDRVAQDGADAQATEIERAAACAMLHSFYTEIEKILKLIARDWDGHLPSSETWHRELLKQMAATTENRPAVFSLDILEVLGEFLAFRHLFRGASIALMRWNKLAPLLTKVDPTHNEFQRELALFQCYSQILQPSYVVAQPSA